MATIILTNPDVDGVLAASLLCAGLPLHWGRDPIQFANYQDLENKLRGVLAGNVEEIYLTDLGIQEIPASTFDELVKRTRIHLIDHHSLSEGRRGQILQSGGTCRCPEPGAQTCSTELAFQTIGLSVGRFALIAEAARSDDFNDPSASAAAQQFARNLGGALMPGSSLTPPTIVNRLVGEISAALRSPSLAGFSVTPGLDAWLQTAADAIEGMQEEARTALQIELVTVTSAAFGNLSVAYARLPDVLFGKPGVEAILGKRPAADVAAAFFDDGACWVFPHGFPRGRRDLVPFLEGLCGGGRDGGGGFGFRGPTNEMNYVERVLQLLTALSAFGNSSEFDAARRAIVPRSQDCRASEIEVR